MPCSPSRRSFFMTLLGAAGGSAALYSLLPGQQPGQPESRYLEKQLEGRREPMLGTGDKLRITRLETFLVQPRWLFLKVHTDAGIVGLGDASAHDCRRFALNA